MSFRNWTLKKTLPYILLITGIIGYAMSFVIMFDRIELLKDPDFIPGCNINPIVSCGDIMASDQAAAFGFPNPFLGLGGFPIVAIIGAALLAGARFKRWFWLGANAGMLFAVGFVHWLFFESVYRIGALCPYCMVVWVSSITGFWYITLYNIDQKHLKLPKVKWLHPAYGWVHRHHLDLLLLWLLIIFGLILKRFWYYYGRNF